MGSEHRLVGSRVPEVRLSEDLAKVKLHEVCAGKTVVMLAVPGAFTPACSDVHLPGFVDNAQALRDLGVDEILCVSMNDPFVMKAWGKDRGTKGKVRMLADTGALTKALGMEMDLTKVFGSVRSKRYSCIIRDGVITHFNEEPEGGVTVSSAETAIDQLRAASSKL